MSVRSLFLFVVFFGLTSCGAPYVAPVVHHGSSSGAGSAGVHNVMFGDTLYSIANRYNLPMRDIVVLNRIQPPYRLYTGQRLKLPPPQEYRVRQGDTLYGVSRSFGVNSSEVAQLNNVKPPYALRVGQVLRLPSVTRKTAAVAKSAVSSGQRAPVSEVSKGSSVSPPKKPVIASKPAVIRDGVPVPQAKPSNVITPSYKPKSKPVKVSRVVSKTPKRSASKFLRPVRGKILSRYGAKKSGLHNDGINIEAARGSPVKAAENGVVVYAGNALKGSGNLILVRHESQWMTAYGHLDSISVRQGQTVKRGAAIGKVGSTGSVSTPQLHFEVRRGTAAMNPTKYME